MKLDDELKELSPWLREIKKQDDGMRLPSGYFEDMESSVFQQLDELGARRRPTAAVPVRPGFWTLLLRPPLALAFGLLLALVAAIWCWPRHESVSPAADQFAASELTAEDAEAYLLENALEVETDLLAAHLPDEEAGAPEPSVAPSREKNALPELEISPDELHDLLDEMSEEELEDLL